MYKFLILLKGSNKDLATCEFTTLWNLYQNEKINLKQIQNQLYTFNSKNLINTQNPLLKRLTYTNYLGLELTTAKNTQDLKKQLNKINLNKEIKKTFAIRIKKTRKKQQLKNSEKEIAQIIWDLLKNPKVDLKSPQTKIILFEKEKSNKIYLTKKIYENEKEYLNRMPKLRPISKPYTLKSDLARATINFLNLKKGTILDPFCGIGGILLEAADMGFNIIGNDISWNDIKNTQKNFKHYFPKKSILTTIADSQTQFLKSNSIDGIVCDIPYGKSSRKQGTNLYENFLKSAQKYLKTGKRIVIIYANFLQFKNLALKHFKKITEIEEYINKSMTRHILVLEK